MAWVQALLRPSLSGRALQVLKVAILAEKYAVDYTWYVDTILNLIRIAGDYVSEEVWYRVIQIVINRDDVQGYAAKTVFEVWPRPAPASLPAGRAPALLLPPLESQCPLSLISARRPRVGGSRSASGLLSKLPGPGPRAGLCVSESKRGAAAGGSRSPSARAVCPHPCPGPKRQFLGAALVPGVGSAAALPVGLPCC